MAQQPETGAIPVARGCGTRKTGGIYWTLGVGEGGVLLEEFLLDPPRPLTMDIPPRGVTPICRKNRDGKPVWHLLDWVGQRYYPNVLDFVEEVRRFGLSRRLPENVDFSKLTTESRLLLVHARAFVTNWLDFFPDRYYACPCGKHHPETAPQPPCCIAVWGEDIRKGKPCHDEGDPRLVERTMPSFSYLGRVPPEGVVAHYQQAVFASMPATWIEVVGGGTQTVRNLDRARTADLNVREVAQ